MLGRIRILLVLIRLRLRPLGLSQLDGPRRGFDDVPPGRQGWVYLTSQCSNQNRASKCPLGIRPPRKVRFVTQEPAREGHYDGDQRSDRASPPRVSRLVLPHHGNGRPPLHSWWSTSAPTLQPHMEVTNDNKSRPSWSNCVTWDKHHSHHRDEGPQRPATQPDLPATAVLGRAQATPHPPHGLSTSAINQSNIPTHPIPCLRKRD